MEIHAAFHDDQAEAGAGTIADIPAAVKGMEQPFLVGFGNANAAIAYGGNDVGAVAADLESDGVAGLGVLDGVGEEV